MPMKGSPLGGRCTYTWLTDEALLLPAVWYLYAAKTIGVRSDQASTDAILADPGNGNPN